jgi:GNAT superfamily N-acetyltransferase
MHDHVSTRTAEPSDAAFAYSAREAAMREYEIAAWGHWNVDQAQSQVSEDIAAGRTKVIQLGHAPEHIDVGVMRVDLYPTHIHLDQLFLLPPYQSLGIGTYLLHALQQEARTKSLRLTLWVLRVNPALRFYERLGFQVIQETAASLRLQSAA